MRSKTHGLAAGLALAAGFSQAPTAVADEVILQWFENSWRFVERRMPDYFMAGYSATWLPPIMQPGDQTSPGFDQFDKFDVGSIDNPTIYGTEEDFIALVDEFQRAGANVYVDTILNHASGRSTSNFFLYDQGGYPGFWAGPRGAGEFKSSTENWGDFHGGNAFGFQQSENPGGANYNLFDGDLVALCDIDQFSNNFFIRHPVEEGNPQNIPGGFEFNRVDPNNRRFYPDRDLPPVIVNNPAVGVDEVIYPFNPDDPMAGDPIAENAAGLIRRHLQYKLEVLGVDGFRLDAVKHVPQAFWNEQFDSAVFNRRRNPDGTLGTPFSFGEGVASNSFIREFTRKDGFGFRDALDINGAGSLRNLVSAGGFGSWQNVFGQHFDNADDGNAFNGTLGVNHAFSHDNGTNGNGGSAPGIPTERALGWFLHAYVLMRPGPSIVYHNGREMHDRFAFRGFWPREGNPEALGLDRDGTTLNDTMTTLVRISNAYASGDFNLLNGNVSDILVFERATNGTANVLVAASDRYDSGFDTRSVNTSFPAGTRLVELTGNAADPDVDPTNAIPDVLTVGANGQVTVFIPRNTSSTGEHNKGYVIYGPAAPDVTLSITNVATILPASPGFVSRWGRRLTPVDVIAAPAFEIRLDTAPGDPVDGGTDDNAVFRWGRGYQDFNGSGSWDLDAGEFRGYEFFGTESSPGTDQGNGQGTYRQAFSTDDFEEGNNYFSGVVFRERSAGGRIYTDARKVVYIDRLPPEVASIDTSAIDCLTGAGELRVVNPDATATEVYVFANLPEGAPIPSLGPVNEAGRINRGLFEIFVSGLNPGVNSFTVVAVEAPQGLELRQTVERFDVTIGGLPGDINLDGAVDVEDLYAFERISSLSCEGDLDADGDNDDDDRVLLQNLVRQNEPADIDPR